MVYGKFLWIMRIGVLDDPHISLIKRFLNSVATYKYLENYQDWVRAKNIEDFERRFRT